MEISEIIRKRKKRFIKELRNIFIIITTLLVFRSVFYEPYRIPTGSMIPTLKIGDFILVNKFSYGFKLPFSDIALFDINLDPIYLFGKSAPERGDVVVFKYPQDTSINYIKRIIGIPGDEIEIRDKVIHINGEAVSLEEVDGSEYLIDIEEKFKATNLRFFKSLIGKHEFIVQQDMDNIYSTHLDKVTIPEGKYFVMGDNRDFSYDSRFWGFVPHEYIRGKAFLVWFSMSLPGTEKSVGIKWDRILNSID